MSRYSTWPQVLLAAVALSTCPLPALAAADDAPLIRRIYAALPPPPAPGDKAGDRRVVRPGLFAHSPPFLEVMDVEGRWLIGVRDGALTVRAAGSEDASVRAMPEGDWRWDIEGARWSPAGDWLAAKLIDDSKVGRFNVTDSNGEEREIAYSRVGAAIARKRLLLLPREGGEGAEVPLRLDYVHPVGFTADASSFRYLEADRFMRHLALRSFDRARGTVTTLLEEKSEARQLADLDLLDGYSDRFDHSNRLVFLDDDDRFLWVSERSGEKHLYLHQPNAPPRNLTAALPGPLLGVVSVDRDRGLALVQSAVADVPWSAETLHRIDLENGGLIELARAPSIQFFEHTGGALTFVAHDLPDQFAIHRVGMDGKPLAEPVRADLSFIAGEGVGLEKLTLRAADGTPIEALLLRPTHTRSPTIPLVEMIYGGPGMKMIPHGPVDGSLSDAYALAKSGMGVVMIDARGTPGRGSAFTHHQDGRLGEDVIADHVAALRQLTAARPTLDADRIGIVGHSWGGHFALRAVIEAPQTYKAAALLSGSIDMSTMRVALEVYQGCLPANCPGSYARGDLGGRLDRLRAPLLIVHGSADDDVLPEESERLAAKLEALGLEHEIVLLEGVDHIVQRAPGHVGQLTAFFSKALDAPSDPEARD